jgi:hypothetical protein
MDTPWEGSPLRREGRCRSLTLCFAPTPPQRRPGGMSPVAASMVGRVRGSGIRRRLICPLRFAFLGDALAIGVSLCLSGSLRGAGSSIGLGLEREGAAFLCKLGRKGWCRFHGCREGASDDQSQRAQSSQNRRHGTPFIVVGAILLSRRCIAAIPADAIPVISVARSRTTLRNLCKVELGCAKFGFAA